LDKFNRKYILDIATEDEGPFDLTIKPPFTIEFDITRSFLTSANVCQIRIYNLSSINRNRIRHNSSDYGNFKSIQLRAGYGDNLVIIFSGNISQAWSVREGVNFITQIECFDGGFAYNNGVCNLQFPAGTPIKSIILAIAATLPNIKLGAVGDYPGTIPRANSYSGNSMFILQEITGGGAFIDNEKFFALGENEYVQSLSGVGTINSNSGLLATPMLEQNIVRFDMIFEPGLNIGQRIFLDSIAERAATDIGIGFNGNYIIKSVKHRGMISDAVCGTVVTTGEVSYVKIPTPVVPLS
jgi:hypothetical protein